MALAEEIHDLRLRDAAGDLPFVDDRRVVPGDAEARAVGEAGPDRRRLVPVLVLALAGGMGTLANGINGAMTSVGSKVNALLS